MTASPSAPGTAGELWHRITARAEAEPDRIAVDGERRVSYAELVERVSRFADRLRSACGPGDGYGPGEQCGPGQPCGPGDVVAIRATTSLAGLVAILATGVLGAAFLPLDTAAPPSWQDERVRDAGSRLLVSEAADSPDELEVTALPGTAGNAVPRGTAYLMLTSGSTGRPKGVLVSGTALADRLAGLAEVPGFGPDDSFLALTALSFDICLAELLLPLFTGGRTVLAAPAARSDPEQFADAVRRYRPSVIQATPSFWRLALTAGWRGSQAGDGAVLWCGGEALADRLAEQLLACGRQLWNLYGPTEATIWCTAARVEAGRPVSLGDPLPGSHCLLVDGAGGLITEPGPEGELVLGGAGLATGYLGAPADQARFTRLTGIEGTVYRTGDRAVYRPDRTLAFLGRQDGQVKLRGHRLELGAVESAIEEHPDIQQAFVHLCEPDDPKRAHLAAMVSAVAPLTSRDLRRWLAGRVPQVMLPKRILVLDNLPRTTAGKLDRVALRELDGAPTEATTEADDRTGRVS